MDLPLTQPGDEVCVKYSAGIHPWELDYDKLGAFLLVLMRRSLEPNVVAIGECGLDKLIDIPMEWQKNAFEKQIEISEEVGKPLIIHSVKTTEDLIRYRKNKRPRQAWIIHGFRGKRQEMESLINHGFYLSFGIRYNEDALKNVPIERLFLETDDEKCSIREVYKSVSEALEISEQCLIERIEGNVSAVFYSLKK